MVASEEQKDKNSPGSASDFRRQKQPPEVFCKKRDS